MVVVGAGHNGLVAALRLARAGARVSVYEAADVVGGACRTEFPFTAAPTVAASTGAYLLGLMPPELLEALELDLPLRRRDPHYLLPARPGRAALLLGGDAAANHAALARVFSPADARADAALGAELAQLRDDLGPSWLTAPMSVEDTAQRWVRPALHSAYLGLVRGSALDYLRRFGFASDELLAMYAATDAMPGSAIAPDEPGSGHNLLVHSMCRLPGADGTWMSVAGGMGNVTGALAGAARAAGVAITTGCPVAQVLVQAGVASGVVLADGTEERGDAVVAALDPHRMLALTGAGAQPDLAARLTAFTALPGMTLKLNLALAAPPDFGVPLTGPGTTVHLLRPGSDGSFVTGLAQAYADARAGRPGDSTPVEVYVSDGLATGVFVQPVPADLADTGAAAARALAVVETAAPGITASVLDSLALGPKEIEGRFGITGGHIFHVDNSLATIDRVPARSEVPGLYAAGAGSHPAGSVIGAAGWNAAGAVLADLAG